MSLGAANVLTMGCQYPFYGVTQDGGALALVAGGWVGGGWNYVSFAWSTLATTLIVNDEGGASPPPSNFVRSALRIGSGGETRAEVDDVALFDRALTQIEVDAIRNASTPIKTSCRRP